VLEETFKLRGYTPMDVGIVAGLRWKRLSN